MDMRYEPRGNDARKLRVLIIDGDSDVMSVYRQSFTQAGYQVTAENSPERGVKYAEEDSPHLVLFDWDIPGPVTTGSFNRMLKIRSSQQMRLVITSAVGADHAVSLGLNLGADDYIVKPCSIPIVMARVRALMRVNPSERDEARVLCLAQLRVEVQEQRVTAADQVVALRYMQFKLLEFLMRYPNRVFSRSDLITKIWGRSVVPDERAVDVNIQRIRKALAPHACDGYLQTVRGVGYRISAQGSLAAGRA